MKGASHSLREPAQFMCHPLAVMRRLLPLAQCPSARYRDTQTTSNPHLANPCQARHDPAAPQSPPRQ
jgi:hypothetical protein